MKISFTFFALQFNNFIIDNGNDKLVKSQKYIQYNNSGIKRKHFLPLMTHKSSTPSSNLLSNQYCNVQRKWILYWVKVYQYHTCFSHHTEQYAAYMYFKCRFHPQENEILIWNWVRVGNICYNWFICNILVIASTCHSLWCYMVNAAKVCVCVCVCVCQCTCKGWLPRTFTTL